MNRSASPHHKMLTRDSEAAKPVTAPSQSDQRTSERGYTLVALLALMTIVALFAMAAAPSITHQSMREREIETIYRGEEVADAIRLYHAYQRMQNRQGDNALPTTMDQLLEGVSFGTKKIHVLRYSAARDPLSEAGEWRLVKPRSSQLADFSRSIMEFAGNIRPPTNDPQLKAVEQVMAPPVLPTLEGISSVPAPSVDDSASGPFIGVSPEHSGNSIITYYGIDRHDGWVFTPLFR